MTYRHFENLIDYSLENRILNNISNFVNNAECQFFFEYFIDNSLENNIINNISNVLSNAECQFLKSRFIILMINVFQL